MNFLKHQGKKIRKISVLAAMSDDTKRAMRLQYAKSVKDDEFANNLRRILRKPPKKRTSDEVTELTHQLASTRFF